MKKNLKLIDWIICDDLRRENNGKLIFVGVYLDAIVVPSVPCVLPQLVLFSRWDFGGAAIEKFQCAIVGPDKKNCAELTGTLQGQQHQQKKYNLQFGISPFKIEKTGLYTIIFTIDGAKVSTGEFEVRLKE
ncbi:MAG: hypothetical protein FJ119_08785 [Deltaproteobacteria bacterium]|nr:hypothetical protein [Deltaproteobacteria bacterium]